MKRFILITAAIVFVSGIVLSIRAQPELVDRIALQPLVLLTIVAVPCAVALSVLEFLCMAKLAGTKVSVSSAAETTIIGSMANLLPIPGGTLVRVAALKASGTTVKRGANITLLAAAVWLGICLAYAGPWLAAFDQHAFAAILFSAGIAVIIGCGIWAQLYFGGFINIVGLTSIRLLLTLSDAVRLYLCFWCLGLTSGIEQVSVLTLSSFAGAAFSLVPAGLGVREGVAAVLGPVISISAPAAYLATSLNRILGLVVVIPMALWIAARSRAGANQNLTSAVPATSQMIKDPNG